MPPTPSPLLGPEVVTASRGLRQGTAHLPCSHTSGQQPCPSLGPTCPPSPPMSLPSLPVDGQEPRPLLHWQGQTWGACSPPPRHYHQSETTLGGTGTAVTHTSLVLSPPFHSSVSTPPQILITITEHQWPRHDGTKQSSSQEEMGHRMIPRHPWDTHLFKGIQQIPYCLLLVQLLHPSLLLWHRHGDWEERQGGERQEPSQSPRYPDTSYGVTSEAPVTPGELQDGATGMW